MFDPARLVFIDETAASTKMVRLRGRCPRRSRWYSGLRYDAIVAPFVIDGPMNGRVSLTYVERCLAPTLGRGDIVIMDNLPIAGATEAIGPRMPWQFICLRILRIFSKFKALSRKAAERTIPALSRRIRSILRGPARRNV
jgi:hypothetical protein